jgi:hypothetical protein
MYAGAVQESGAIPTYDVMLPEAGLGWEKVGPLFERYSVKLIGQIDEHWIKVYQSVVASSPKLTRFRFDPATGAVSFTCRATDGPVEVMGVLRILAEMIERVNRAASLGAVGPVSGAGPGRIPPARPVVPRPDARATKTFSSK